MRAGEAPPRSVDLYHLRPGDLAGAAVLGSTAAATGIGIGLSVQGLMLWPLDRAITGLAHLHAEWYGREAELVRRPWIGHVPSSAAALEMAPLWRALGRHAEPYFAQWATPAVVSTHHELVETIGDWWPPGDSPPRTLVHGDFNPRNIALRHTASGVVLCAYDWELATVGMPQHDLAEFLCFVLMPDVAGDDAARWVERHRLVLAAAAGISIDESRWHAGFRIALRDLLINRLAFYTMINRAKPGARRDGGQPQSSQGP